VALEQTILAQIAARLSPAPIVPAGYVQPNPTAYYEPAPPEANPIEKVRNLLVE
jgi:hypothetical protein